MSEAFKFAVFISYSRADERWAKWLHGRLEKYRVPSRLAGTTGAHGVVPARIGRCFRDLAELSAASHLDATLKQALSQSRALVVVCSPRSAASQWVNEEIRYFRSLGRSEQIFALIVDGDPAAGEPARQCFPAALLQDAQGQPLPEPLAADVRDGEGSTGDAFMKLAAGLLGVDFDALRRREQRRQMRLMAATVALSLGVAGLTSVLAISASRARSQAELQQRRTERVKDYLVSIFAEQNPFARGNTVARTPTQLLDDAATRLDTELVGDPNLHAELLNDLGKIQNDLGDIKAGAALLERALAERTARFGPDSLQVAQTLQNLASLLLTQQKIKESEQAGRRALALLKAHDEADPLDIARTEMALGNTVNFGKGSSPEALGFLNDALQRFESGLGEDHPETLKCLYLIGQFYEQGRDDKKAEVTSREVVRRAERRYGKDSVILATALRPLGQVLARAGHADEAEAVFDRMISILRTQLGARSGQLASTLSSQGVLMRNQRRLIDAEHRFAEALAALPDDDPSARDDILRGKGRVALLLGHADAAEKDLHEAYESRRATLSDKNAFTWYFASEWGRGLAAQKRFKEAEAIQTEAVEKLSTLMGPEASQNALVLDALADTLEAQSGRSAEAEPLRRKQLAVIEVKFPKPHPLWAESAEDLARNLSMTATPAARTEALALSTEALLILRGNPSDREALAEACSLQAGLLAAAGRQSEALSVAREALAVFATIPQPDLQRVGQTQLLLKKPSG